MKTSKWLLAATLPLALLFSCQKQIASLEDEATPVRNVKPKFVYSATSCSNFCIDPAAVNPEYYILSGSLTGAVGTNAKAINYSMYNTLSKFYVTVNYVREPATSGASTPIKVTVGGVSKTECVANKTSTTLEFDLPANWQACTELSWDIVESNMTGCDVFQGQLALHGTGTYKLIGPCVSTPACTESFSYSTADNKTVLFTYVSPVDVPNAVVQLTDPHVSGYTPTDGKTYTVNNSGNVTVLTWTGNIAACVPVTFALTYTPDCSQNTAGFANVWTDFKVNAVSKKNLNTPNIKFTCP